MRRLLALCALLCSAAVPAAAQRIEVYPLETTTAEDLPLWLGQDISGKVWALSAVKRLMSGAEPHLYEFGTDAEAPVRTQRLNVPLAYYRPTIWQRRDTLTFQISPSDPAGPGQTCKVVLGASVTTQCVRRLGSAAFYASHWTGDSAVVVTHDASLRKHVLRRYRGAAEWKEGQAFDPAFGVEGETVLPLSSAPVESRIARLSDGRYLVAGLSEQRRILLTWVSPGGSVVATDSIGAQGAALHDVRATASDVRVLYTIPLSATVNALQLWARGTSDMHRRLMEYPSGERVLWTRLLDDGSAEQLRDQACLSVRSHVPPYGNSSSRILQRYAGCKGTLEDALFLPNDRTLALLQTPSAHGGRDAALARYRTYDALDLRYGTLGYRVFPDRGRSPRTMALSPGGGLLAVDAGDRNAGPAVFRVQGGVPEPVLRDSTSSGTPTGILRGPDGSVFVSTQIGPSSTSSSFDIPATFRLYRYASGFQRDYYFGLQGYAAFAYGDLRPLAHDPGTTSALYVKTSWQVIVLRWSGDRPEAFETTHVEFLDTDHVYTDGRQIAFRSTLNRVAHLYPYRGTSPHYFVAEARSEAPFGVAPAPDGSMLEGVSAYHVAPRGLTNGAAIRKAHATGWVDSTYILQTHAALQAYHGLRLLSHPDGSAFVVGAAKSGSAQYLLKLRSDGSRDAAFGTDGSTPLPERFQIHQIELYDLHTLVLAGTLPSHTQPGRLTSALLYVRLDQTPTSTETALSPLAPAFAVSPQPMHGAATVRVAARADGRARLELFDLLGRRVATLHDGPLRAGEALVVPLDASALAPGVYVLRLDDAAGMRSLAVRVAR